MKINSSLFRIIITRCDAIIRFVYCQFGPFSKLLNKLLFWKLYSSNIKDLDYKFEEFKSVIIKQSISLADAKILEIGPGNSTINAMNFLLSGVAQVIMVDKYSRFRDNKKQIKHQEKEIEFIRNKWGISLLPFIDEKNKLREKYVRYYEKDISQIENQNVDIIYSISVLEHIKNVESSIQHMTHHLKTGGYMYHDIDLRDHYNFNDPFLFLKYSNYSWNKYLTKEGISYTNRVRYRQYKEIFASLNLITLWEKAITYPLPQHPINRDFRNKKDINVGKLKILLRKI